MRAVCCVLLVLLACLCLQAVGVDLPSFCNLPSDAGNCDALFRKYFYNSQSAACEEFTYGGCPGNANRFNTIEECQAACAPGTNS
ncbi:hypothetical protein BsWGS_23813 [Bradybaena similaris]